MSHITRIEISVKDLQALKQACKDLGLEFVDGQTHYRWFSRFMGDTELPQGMKESDLGKCHHAIRIPNDSTAYELGVRKQKDGSYQLVYDYWQGGFGLENVIGKGAQKLVQSYAAAVTTNLYKKQGFRVTKSVTKDGAIRLIANK